MTNLSLFNFAILLVGWWRYEFLPQARPKNPIAILGRLCLTNHEDSLLQNPITAFGGYTANYPNIPILEIFWQAWIYQ